MEVLSVQNQFQGQFGVLGKNKGELKKFKLFLLSTSLRSKKGRNMLRR